MSFSLKRLYAFKDEEGEKTSNPASYATTKPLLIDKTSNKVNFPGSQYQHSDDITFYSMSDRIGRNYTPSSSGISLSNVRNILRGKESNTFQMPDFVDSAITQHRPLNIPKPIQNPPYDSKELSRSISSGALDIKHASPRALSKSRTTLSQSLTTSIFTQSASRTAWEPNALSTPRESPKLFTSIGEIPTTLDCLPLKRMLNTRNVSNDLGPQIVDASLPYNVDIQSMHAQVETSALQYQLYLENIYAQIKKEKTELQNIADVTIRRKWMKRALSMVPKGSKDEVILDFVSELDQEHWESNADSQVQYELKHPASQSKLGIDREFPKFCFFLFFAIFFEFFFFFSFAKLALV